MNKRIDFEKLGGYPMAQEDLNWMQVSYQSAFASLATLLGDRVIVSGMNEVGGVVSNGWISISGELLPFIGGAIGTGECIIEETKETLMFEDGEAKEVLITRMARFGSPDPAFNYSDLTRPGTFKEIWQLGDIKPIYCDAAYRDLNFDGTGLGINKRIGWAICNGSNGTPDLGGRVPVGYNPDDLDYDEVGKMGGEKTHVLTINEMPAHYHGTGTETHGDAAYRRGPAHNVRAWGGTNTVSFPSSTGDAGGGTPHENRPPFFTLLFIMKL